MHLQYSTHLTDYYRITKSHLCILIPDSIHFMTDLVIFLTLVWDVIKFVFPKCCFQSVSLPVSNQIWADTPDDSSLGESSVRCFLLAHFMTLH